jgi:hypothetical protein
MGFFARRNTNNYNKVEYHVSRIVFASIFGCLLFTAFLMAVIPPYNVWHQHMAGKAVLAKAEYSRKIAVVESEAKMMSSKNLAMADTLRARGIAQSNNIIGKSLTSEYIRWYYIDGLNKQQNKTTIYIPTEAMLPITEANRAKQDK